MDIWKGEISSNEAIDMDKSNDRLDKAMLERNEEEKDLQVLYK